MQLPATATLEQAAALAAELPAAVAERSGVLHIDASALTALDSSTLALLLQARRLAQAAGRTVAVDATTLGRTVLPSISWLLSQSSAVS